MTLGLTEKKAIVAEVAEVASRSVSLATADYRGLSVVEMTALRAKAREQGVHIRVVRNNLAKKSFEGTNFDCVNSELVGPLMLMFSLEEPSAAARLLKSFSKEYAKLETKSLVLDGTLYGAADLDSIAALPTKDEAIAKLLSAMKAPVAKLVQTMAGVPSKLVRTLAAVRDSKEI